MSRVDMLAFKMYSYDTDSFVEDVIRYSNNSIVLVHDFDKITVYKRPSNIKLRKDTINFFRVKNPRLVYMFSPFMLLLEMFTIVKLFSTICWRYRPRVCWIENSYAALVVGILRKCRLCEKSIYLPGDWVVSAQNKKLLSYVANNLLFPIVDYLACRLNDVVLNHTEQIGESRRRYWGKKIAKKEKLYQYKMQIRADNAYGDTEKKAICFIGNMREDSGLDIAIKCLTNIRKKHNVILRIVGPKKQHYEYFRKLSKECDVDPYVEFLGFVETDRFAEKFSDCFCAINLVTNTDSYSSYTIPGKLVHYLQYLLPVITTEGAGPFTSIIREEELGLVIEPTENAFMSAVNKVYEEFPRYRQNIVQYINSMPKVDIKELIES